MRTGRVARAAGAASPRPFVAGLRKAAAAAGLARAWLEHLDEIPTCEHRDRTPAYFHLERNNCLLPDGAGDTPARAAPSAGGDPVASCVEPCERKSARGTRKARLQHAWVGSPG